MEPPIVYGHVRVQTIDIGSLLGTLMLMVLCDSLVVLPVQ
jgi:hypothetical protein